MIQTATIPSNFYLDRLQDTPSSIPVHQHDDFHHDCSKCFVPPHIEKKIQEAGDEAIRYYSKQFRKHRKLEQQRIIEELPQEQLPMQQSTTVSSESVLGNPVIKIYDAQNSFNLPGNLMTQRDAAGSEAYNHIWATYNLYASVYKRDSIDNKGMPINAIVHVGKNYRNAFWDGRYMAFGDADENLPSHQQIFLRFTRAIDVPAHELTHGVTQYTSPLVYQNQSGALNESFSDIIGSLVKQYSRNQSAAEADWLIGDEIMPDNQSKKYALRSLKAPGTAYVNHPILGTDPQPAKMSEYKNISYDNGGVHINSGIPNKAFYLASQEIGGHAWEKAGRVWYETMNSRMVKSNSTFKEFANLTVLHAGKIYGTESAVQKAVRKAWISVEVL
jgi:Zn-dependent metalloprotease